MKIVLRLKNIHIFTILCRILIFRPRLLAVSIRAESGGEPEANLDLLFFCISPPFSSKKTFSFFLSFFWKGTGDT